jgi:hypothetical protein
MTQESSSTHGAFVHSLHTYDRVVRGFRRSHLDNAMSELWRMTEGSGFVADERIRRYKLDASSTFHRYLR